MHDTELTLYQDQYKYSCEIQTNVNTVILFITSSPATYWHLIQLSHIITYCNHTLITICKSQIWTIYQISTNKGYVLRHEICDTEYFGQIYLHYNETILHFGNIYWNSQHSHSSQIRKTRTTRMPAFWWYPCCLMITHTIESYSIPSQNKTTSKYRYFEVKLTFQILTVRGQQHSFLTHQRVFLWKCQSFWDRKCLDLRGTRTPNLRIHAEWSNLLSYQGQTFAVPCYWTLAVAVQIFWSKVNIWNVNCARATTFIFDTRTGVLVKV